MFNQRIVSALICLCFMAYTTPVSAAGKVVSANISFAGPVVVSTGGSGGSRGSGGGGGFGSGTSSENSPHILPSTGAIQLPVLITINTFGSVWIAPAAMSESGHSRDDKKPGIINFSGPDDQVMNFLAYGQGEQEGMIPIKTVCSVNGARSNNCDNLYGILKKAENPSFFGGNMTSLGSLSPSSSVNSNFAVFDLCAVYQ